MKQTFKDAKVFFGGVEIAEIESGTYEFDSEGTNECHSKVTPGVVHTTFTTQPIALTEYEAQAIWLLDYNMFPSLTPDGSIVGSVLGVFAWRMLAELQAPLHRRAAMAQYWIKAMQARYVVQSPGQGLPAVYVPGEQRAMIADYDRIRREAGDFDRDELEGLN